MGQAKPVLVPDVSQRAIEIAYSFTGAELLLFGAILYPAATARPIPRIKPADIVVVVKGPTQSVLVREKEKVAGIWVNAESMRYRSAPSFYAIASSKPIREIVDERTRAIYELGVDSLQLSPASGAAPEVQAALRSRAGRPAHARRPLLRGARRSGDHRRRALSRAAQHPGARAGGALHRRDLPDPRRPRARRRGAADRHPQIGLRALRRQRRGALLDRPTA
jgi:hypothetical protein